MSESVIWHDIECGGYEQDLPLWLNLAEQYVPDRDGAILDVGAGTGRVSLVLARAGHRVVAVDLEDELLTALAERAADGLPVEAVQADARELDLPGRTFPLCVVPMQTIQLFGGAEARMRFIAAAGRHLTPGGALAIALADSGDFEEFEWRDGDPFPLPDIVELDGNVYCSQPTAVRRQGNGFILERRREVIDAAGGRQQSDDLIVLDTVTASEIEEAGQRAGLKRLGRREVPATAEHIGSQVVVLGR